MNNNVKYLMIFFAIVAVVSIVYLNIGKADDEMFENQIIINFENGMTKTYDEITSLNTVEYEGMPVDSVTFKLYVTATGQEFTSWEYDDWQTLTEINKKTSDSSWEGYWQIPSNGGLETVSGETNLPFDTKYQIYERTVNLDDVMSGAEEGEYLLRFYPYYDFTYRGLPGGDWKTYSLSGDYNTRASLYFDVVDNSEIILNFNSDDLI